MNTNPCKYTFPNGETCNLIEAHHSDGTVIGHAYVEVPNLVSINGGNEKKIESSPMEKVNEAISRAIDSIPALMDRQMEMPSEITIKQYANLARKLGMSELEVSNGLISFKFEKP